MKHNFLILAAIIISFTCFLQEQQAVAAEELKPELVASGPTITFEKVVCNLGNIAPGSENVCEFKFTNTGNKLLRITKVDKTCGCTPFTLTKKKYEPGESGVLKVKYNASSRPSSVTKTLIVHSNDEAKSEVRLTIKGDIIPKISYLPKSIDLLLNKENAGCPEITIKSLDGKPFSIKGFDVKWRSRSVKGGITADYDPSAEATEFVLQPKVDVEKAENGLSGHIEIALTHPENGMVAIPFSVLPRFKVTPRSLIVYKAEAGKPVTKEVWVLSNYGDDFEVESTSTQEGTIKVLSQEKVDNRYKFELEVTPPAIKKGQKKYFTDELFINIKDGEKLKVTCRLFYS